MTSARKVCGVWVGRPRARSGRPWTVASALVLALLLSACATTPIELPDRPPAQSALAPQPGDAFEQIETEIAARHGPASSGFALLDRNEDALRWRLALIDAARYSLDLQYYLWYGDATGKVMTKHVLDAADRGVRVRIIVDDINTMISDAATVMQRDSRAALLDAHPNIELRLYNAWRNRAIADRVGEALSEMERLNQRMHNKALIVDNRAAIVGGRNLGDDYMGLHEAFNFHDLDVLGIGPVARQVSEVFDTFWNSAWVLPVAALGIEPSQQDKDAALAHLNEALAGLDVLERFPLEREDPTDAIAALAGRLHVGTSRMFTDLPTDDTIQREMIHLIYGLLDTAEREVLITNAYIIPGERAIDNLARLGERGVAVRILTNSLASHDVPAVNSHYKKSRKPLIRAGADLYEMRHDAAIKPLVADTPPTVSEFMGLHTKAVVVDRERAYIGSMNFDPRSAAINTEMGIVIESPSLSVELAELMERDMQPANSWHVQLDEDGKLYWESSDAVVTRQPARSFWQRVQDVFFMMFPEEMY
jgi:putative cardiolipin synthase